MCVCVIVRVWVCAWCVCVCVWFVVAVVLYRRNGKWVEWTYDQYYADVRKFAKSLIAVGFKRHEVLV